MEQQIVKVKNKKGVKVIPGYGLCMGITLVIFSRGIGEYGSVVFIAGNIPYRTQIAPLLIMMKLEQYKYRMLRQLLLFYCYCHLY